MEDCLTLGAKLKQEEKETRENAIAWALSKPGNPKLQGGAWTQQERKALAMALYEARYDGTSYEDNPSAEEILENFCFRVFGCTFDEVLKAWDRELG